MNVLYPRLLVEDFETSTRFWEAALRDLLGIAPVKILPEDGYAKWAVGDEALLVVFTRSAITEVIGTAGLPSPAAAQDAAMLALPVQDVEAACAVLVRHGATVLAPARDRPEWGAGLRTGHLRAPDGTLIELQSYAESRPS
ncbi:glyoxalase/bleomycin resistance/extradiol dioxygenase family protein [Streptomyces sp. AV19]|uniref:VOC family protein n=1 Tax=Streptomyces sp. AV19 TaxID=2793068 RepID=UPI0018FE7421|nr:VOC family protein [Streptomyces sp. AV19]MBH1938666.1 glyoxalase/bleomycin resistance/extradiol dioxygenase family protein [Streptomyces sp. AV19]MDG4535378.1 glyoxalase/bleomycin resistance/extradiol dioxygenase family protein [Streptomyces sp. AV19]